MSSAKDLLQYDIDLDDAITNCSDDVFYNDSILHALIIMKHLFRKAQNLNEGQRTMNIFCGNFSLFRDKTREKIEKEKKEYSLEGLCEKERKKWDNWDLFGELQKALSDFLETDKAKLNLIMMRDIDTLCENSVWNTLKTAIERKKMSIFLLDHEKDLGLGEFHFAVISDAYRIETSDEHKKATCCFCDKDGSNILNSNFAELQKNSLEVFL